MKPKLSLKTLLRTPVKTFLTFLLVAAVSFGLFSQVAEYAMTAREFEDNIGMYYASVSVEAEPASYRKLKFPYYLETDERVNATGIDKLNEQGYKLITAEQTEKIAAMSYVSTVYKRYMTAGAAEDFYRLDDTPKNVTNGTAYSPNSFYDYCARLVVEGTVDRYKDGISDITDPMKMYRVYSISDCRVLAGQAELEDLLLAGDRIEFITVQNEWLGEQFASDSNIPKGERLEDLNLRAGTISIGDRIINVYFGTYKYFGNYIDELLQPGRRYVFTLRYERTGHGLQGQNIGLYDWATEPWCPAVWDITDAPENYLELEEYAPLKLLTELTNTDIHTLDVVYADDMSVIRQIENGSMKIAEGRWLSTDDTAAGADVCVISNIFADEYGLKVGDTISMKLGHELFETYYTLGAVAATKERFSDTWTDAEFEIVGIYKDSDTFSRSLIPNWTYSNNTVFVPLSALPLTESELEGHNFSPADISFKIDNAWDIEPFKNECVPVIENEMGLKVTLDDGGWSEVVKSYSSVQKLAAVKISLLCCVTLASTIFVVYLFISRKRKDYAVMRALGTTKSSAGAAMLIPLIAVTAFGVAVGTAAGLIYTVQARQINELFETFTDYMPSTQVPLWPLIVCILGEAAAVILFACIMLYKLGKTPPLALLSDNHGKAKKTVQNQKQNTAEYTGVFKAVSASINKPAVGIPAEPLIIHNRRCAVRFYIKYIFLHIKRSFLKSILTVVVAVLMSAAIMQYVQMMQTYLQLRESTVVTPKFVDLLPLYKLTMLEQDGFAENVYYAKTLLADVHIGTEYFERAMTITNDVSRYTMEECDIEYADGFDESCWDSVADIVFIGKYYNEHYGIKPGDKIKISPQGKMRDIMIMFNFERFEPAIDEICEEMTVAGVISTESGAFDDSLFTPGTLETVSTLGCGNLMNIAEFNLTDNTLVTQMREYGEQMQKSTNGTFIMDTSKLENVINTSEVLQRLYPAVIAAAIIIGSFMCSLIIFQSAKEAAIMRVLGTTRRSTGVIIAAEQIILVFVGLVLATAAMVLLKKQALLDVSDKVIMFEVLYIAAATAVSAVSSVITTKKNILELLQTKE